MEGERGGRDVIGEVELEAAIPGTSGWMSPMVTAFGSQGFTDGSDGMGAMAVTVGLLLGWRRQRREEISNKK